MKNYIFLIAVVFLATYVIHIAKHKDHKNKLQHTFSYNQMKDSIEYLKIEKKKRYKVIPNYKNNSQFKRHFADTVYKNVIIGHRVGLYMPTTFINTK